MKMVNIHLFDKSMKLDWIKKIISQTDVHTTVTGKLDKLTTFGPDWCKFVIQRSKNPFWKQVFLYWKEFCQVQKPTNNSDVMHAPLWFNPQISQATLYLTTWKNKGISMVGDIMNTYGNILGSPELKGKYRL